MQLFLSLGPHGKCEHSLISKTSELTLNLKHFYSDLYRANFYKLLGFFSCAFKMQGNHQYSGAPLYDHLVNIIVFQTNSLKTEGILGKRMKCSSFAQVSFLPIVL